MQAPHADVFALKNSRLETFLYAYVGAELNGSPLTVLSMLARLGRDPWAEAAKWATLPGAGAIESLAESMAQMPLVPSALAEIRVTATRLVRLLPSTPPSVRQPDATKAQAPLLPGLLPITILYCAMALGMALSSLLLPKPSQAVAMPIEQPIPLAGEPGGGALPSVHGGAVAKPAAALSSPRTR